MTHMELESAPKQPFSRHRGLPPPACGAMPRMLFWKLAFSAVFAACAMYFWRR